VTTGLNRAKEDTATTGTGTITFAGAVTAFQTWLAAGAVDGITYPYLIEDGNDWELGPGVIGATGTTITRCPAASPYFMSSTGSALSLSGTATIACVAAANPGYDGRLLGAPWTIPKVADFTTFNLGSVVVADSPSGINSAWPTHAFQLRGFYRAPPSAPYSIYARVSHLYVDPANNTRYGILLQNSTSGRSILFNWMINTGGAAEMRLNRWSSNTSYSSETNLLQATNKSANWVKVDITSTQITAFSIGDGYNWLSTGMTAETLSSFINSSGTVDRIGFACAPYTSTCFTSVTLNSFSTTAPEVGGGGQA